MVLDSTSQIAERKKLVSSIKSSIIDPESDELPYEEHNGSFSSIGVATTEDDKISEDLDNESLSTSGTHSPVHDVNENPTSASSEYSFANMTEPGKDLHHNDKPQPKATTSESVQSQEVPSVSPRSSVTPSPEPFSNKDSYKWLNNATELISSSETSNKVESDKLKDANVGTTILSDAPLSLKYEKIKDEEESNLEDTKVKVQDPIGEDVKPPPLAGPNVMNVILVAAECAPWCKTGMSITMEFSKREQNFPISISFACRSYCSYPIINM